MAIVVGICEMVFFSCLICLFFLVATAGVSLVLFVWFLVCQLRHRNKYSFPAWIIRKGSCL